MQAHNKRGKKGKWNNVARGLKRNKKSFYKYIQEKEQNKQKYQHCKVKMLSKVSRNDHMPIISFILFSCQ